MKYGATAMGLAEVSLVLTLDLALWVAGVGWLRGVLIGGVLGVLEIGVSRHSARLEDCGGVSKRVEVLVLRTLGSAGVGVLVYAVLSLVVRFAVARTIPGLFGHLLPIVVVLNIPHLVSAYSVATSWSLWVAVRGRTYEAVGAMQFLRIAAVLAVCVTVSAGVHDWILYG